ncbi:MAG: NIPSNAP family protein, partial [Fimbriiglobus sp.]
LLVLAMPAALPAADPTPLYELRVYYAAPGKLDALHARFRDHTAKLFEKHGMTNVGYWTPIENPDNKLIYVLSHPDMAARQKSLAAFLADPEWLKAKAASETDGKLVAKIEETFLTPTDYSPAVTLGGAGTGRVFELRTYTASPGNLAALNSRFRDHTVKLFEKHGMTNLWYWTPAAGQKGENDTLIYFLAHPSVEARNKAFDGFRADPDWVKARTASEAKAGGSLTTTAGPTKNGVLSEMLKPTDYSPMR